MSLEQMPKYWFKQKQGMLFAYIQGDVDMEIAAGWREAIDAEIQKTFARNLIFDFSQVTFIDSSGLGVIMGRYKKISSRGGKVIVQGANEQVQKILMLSGLEKIMRIIPSVENELEQVGGSNDD